jgi:hypothetical protein
MFAERFQFLKQKHPRKFHNAKWSISQKNSGNCQYGIPSLAEIQAGPSEKALGFTAMEDL